MLLYLTCIMVGKAMSHFPVLKILHYWQNYNVSCGSFYWIGCHQSIIWRRGWFNMLFWILCVRGTMCMRKLWLTFFVGVRELYLFGISVTNELVFILYYLRGLLITSDSTIGGLIMFGRKIYGSWSGALQHWHFGIEGMLVADSYSDGFVYNSDWFFSHYLPIFL